MPHHFFPRAAGTKDYAREKNTKAPEGATTGAGTGALLGGGLGWLLAIGALAIPGLGPFMAAGPIMAALAGAGVGGAVGGLTGALIGMGIPEYEAKRYEGRVKDGGILLSVRSHCYPLSGNLEPHLRASSPHAAGVLGDHWLSRLAAKGLLEGS
jgi:tetrahydromethanopterin S-methyltransferase subunit C